MKFALLLAVRLTLDVSGFDVISSSEPVPESNPVTRIRVTHMRAQYSFIVPSGWKMGSNPEVRRIWMQTEDSQSSIVLQLTTNSMPADSAVFRQQLTNRWEGAFIISEFTAPSGGCSGLGIDLRRKVNDRVWMMSRVCAFKTANCAVELCLTTRADDWDALQPAWTSFINSFRVESVLASTNQK